MADSLSRERTTSERVVALESKFESLLELLNVRESNNSKHHRDNTGRLDAILDQVRTTNGRVNTLESWKDKFSGGWVVMLVVGGVVGALLSPWLQALAGKMVK